ncbi:MAG TPA: potassium transporter TrkG, partial [Hyphomicrobiaceae bacterium]|nr:potassium transporter TrkG [Hyphomicrobiaceae bacterium]
MFATRSILLSLGLFLCTIAAMMLLPAIVDLADRNPDWKVFAASALLCFFIGSLLILFASDDRPATLDTKSGFLLTTLTWVVVTAFCAVPFIGVGLSYTDAYFETMSGLTTTGSTVLVKLDTLPRGVLLWRSILQGIGGLGIIVTAIIMLPFLRIGGAQLFQTESSD